MKGPEHYRSKLQVFEDAERRLFSGELDPKAFKGVSGGFGCYAQRGADTLMVRLRMCGGHMDLDKLDFIIGCCERYGLDHVHMTTCGTVQLHGLRDGQASAVMRDALDHGINTQGGGGDNPRNVSATSLSGIEPGEAFDVYPYAKATESYLLDIMDDIVLPRKLKVTFSSSSCNETHATFRDMGFIARVDGRFDVWTAGGLGGRPSMGILTAEAVEPSDVLYHVRAMVDTFMENGNYGDRSRARTRHMRMDMGDTAYLDAYRRHLTTLKDVGGLDVHPPEARFPDKGEGTVLEGYPRISPQKQSGLYRVTYRPIAGDVPLSMLKAIRGAIGGMEAIGFRVSPDGALHIINLGADEAVLVSDVTEGGAATVFESSVSCVGARICQHGSGDSSGLLRDMVDAVRTAGVAGDALPRVRISGCPSSCGCHQVATIGFMGASRNVDGVPVRVFRVTIDGHDAQGEERFGDLVGDVPADRCADMMVALGLEVTGSGMSFDEWHSKDPNGLRDLLSGFIL